MHRMMRFEPSCEKTKLHGQKDKVHDLKGTACTKLSNAKNCKDAYTFCWQMLAEWIGDLWGSGAL